MTTRDSYYKRRSVSHFSGRLVVVALMLPFIAANLPGETECKSISAPSVARLEKYVHDRFHFDPTTRIVIVGSELVGSSCYRELQFQAAGSVLRMHTTLFLSPDQRFLSRELMDSTVDLTAMAVAEHTSLEQELSRGTFPSRGDLSAPVTITIFSDFQCPFCKQQAEVFKKLDQKVKLVFRNFPLPMHLWARKAAEMATCVYQQSNDAFWALHDSLFAEQEHIDNENVLASTVDQIISKRVDISVTEYQQCLSDHKAANLVEQDIAFARDHGIHSTPTLFVNGVRAEGSMTLEAMQALINQVGNAAHNSQQGLEK